MSRLRIEALRYLTYGPVDLAVETAECVALTGPSGAGKTLMLRAIADLDPHDGRMFLDEAESATLDAPVWRRQVAMLPAESRWWRDTVGEHFGADGRSDRAIAGLLGDLGFSHDVMAWQVSRMSTGERQRLALARLLANRPCALLLDEPTAGLDAENVRRAEELIARYRCAAGAPVLWVSHDAHQVARVANRHFVMSDGTLTERPLASGDGKWA